MSECLVVEEATALSDGYSITTTRAVADTAQMADSHSLARKSTYADTWQGADAAAGQRFMLAADTWHWSTSVAITAQLQKVQSDTWGWRQRYSVRMQYSVTDTAGWNSGYSSARSITVSDAAVLSDAAAPVASRSLAVADTARLSDAAYPIRTASAADSFTITDGAAPRSVSYVLAVDTFTISDAAAPVAHRSTLAADTWRFSTAADITSARSLSVSEVATVGDGYAFAGSVTGSAWTTAMDTLNMARWTNQPVIAAAMAAGHPVVATPDGLYELTGSTDDGVDFTPRLVMPITDLGAKSQTRIDCVYAIVRPGTGVTLAVTPQDMDVEDPFEFEPDGAGASRESTVSLRIKAGLGMRSRMWGLELRGIPGQPFALREADALLIDTRRRI